MEKAYETRKILLHKDFDYKGPWELIGDDRDIIDEIDISTKAIENHLTLDTVYVFTINQGTYVLIPPKILAKCKTLIEIREAETR